MVDTFYQMSHNCDILPGECDIMPDNHTFVRMHSAKIIPAGG